MTEGHDGRRDDDPVHFRSLPQSPSVTAPSSEGAFDGCRSGTLYFSFSSLFSSDMKVLISLNWRYTLAKRT